MALTDEQVMSVMAHADGELEGAEAEAARALVEESAEAKELFASMRALGDGVRSVAEAPAKVDLTDAVMAKVVPNELDRARLKKQGRSRNVAVVVTLTALAAGAWLYSRNDDAPQTESASQPQATTPIVVTPNVTAPRPATSLASNDTPPMEVDAVDTQRPVSVFYVSPDDNGTNAASVVVWIDEPGAQH